MESMEHDLDSVKVVSFGIIGKLMNDPIATGIMLGVLLYSVIIHEMSHAWSALKMGDPTGKDDNRLSWNPIHHIDPFMTILLPIFTAVTWGFPFGGAKPVQINPLNFRDPGKGMMISSAMGPLSNFALAAIVLGVTWLVGRVAPDFLWGWNEEGRRVLTYNGIFLQFAFLINILLGTFNLIPIPPLDGSRVLRYLLPRAGQNFLDRIEPFGLFILIGLIYAGGFGRILGPVQQVAWDLFNMALGGG